MKKILLVAAMAAFFMSKIVVNAESLEEQIQQQYLEQYQEQYEAQLQEQIEALQQEVITVEEPEFVLTSYERDLIAQVVYAEAGNQDLQGKRYVAACILNRVESSLWPNTVSGVIYQPNQFTSWYRGISSECYEAVDLECKERSDSRIIFFCSAGYSYYGTPAYKHGGHWFSYQ